MQLRLLEHGLDLLQLYETQDLVIKTLMSSLPPIAIKFYVIRC